MEMNTKKLVRMALLTATALVIFVAEAQIPSPVPIAGVKLGLANIITVYAMFALGPSSALMIMLARVILGSIFAGQLMMLFYSLGGGLVCWCAMLLLRRVLTMRQVWVCSALGAVFHNAGQLLVAVLITGTPAVLAYFPVLVISGVITGLLTGLCAQLLVDRSGKCPPREGK